MVTPKDLCAALRKIGQDLLNWLAACDAVGSSDDVVAVDQYSTTLVQDFIVRLPVAEQGHKGQVSGFCILAT